VPRGRPVDEIEFGRLIAWARRAADVARPHWRGDRVNLSHCINWRQRKRR